MYSNGKTLKKKKTSWRILTQAIPVQESVQNQASDLVYLVKNPVQRPPSYTKSAGPRYSGILDNRTG